MRRLIIEEPYSHAALWSRRWALFSLAVGAIAVILARSQRSTQRRRCRYSPVRFSLPVSRFFLPARRPWSSGAPAGAAPDRRERGFPCGAASLLSRLSRGKRGAAAAFERCVDRSRRPTAIFTVRIAIAARGDRTPEIPPPQARQEQRFAYPNIQPICSIRRRTSCGSAGAASRCLAWLEDRRADAAWRQDWRRSYRRDRPLADHGVPGGRDDQDAAVGRSDARRRALGLARRSSRLRLERRANREIRG